MDKLLQVFIKMDILPKYNMLMSKYHEVDMEGPSIRRLMSNGTKIFEHISIFLKSSVDKDQSCDKTTTTKNNKVDKIFNSIGKMYLLLDSFFLCT